MWSWHPDADAKFATMLAHRTDDGGQNARCTEERDINVKTVARGMPVVSAEPVVTAACFFSAGGPWVRPASGIPRALSLFERAQRSQNSGALRRESARSFVQSCLRCEYAMHWYSGRCSAVGWAKGAPRRWFCVSSAELQHTRRIAPCPPSTSVETETSVGTLSLCPSYKRVHERRHCEEPKATKQSSLLPDSGLLRFVRNDATMSLMVATARMASCPNADAADGARTRRARS